MGKQHIEVIARGALLDGSKVLVCRNKSRGYLYLPGGHVEFGESAPSALRREFREECGLDVEVGSLLFVTEGCFTEGPKRHHEINLVFLVERRDAGEVPSLEPDIEFVWVDNALIDELDLRPPGVKRWLATGHRDSPTIGLVSDIVQESSGRAPR